MASAQVERPREENIKWREAVVKIDSDTFMRVQYLFNREVSDYKMLASLVSGGYNFGRAWVVNARGVTAENASSQDWTPYAAGSRAAVALLENSGESEVISKRDDVGHATQAQKEHFRAFLDMTAASIEVARNPGDLGALTRLDDAMRRMRHIGRAEREREERAARATEEEAHRAEPVAGTEFPSPKAMVPVKTGLIPKEEAPAETAGRAHSFKFYTPEDPRGISYGFEIQWKEGYVPKGTYDLSDTWSVERFLFANLDGIQYYNITGFVGGNYDINRGVGQFAGESFAVEYLRRAFLRLETEIGGETVRIYVPRELDISGKTFTDFINSPDVVALSVMEEGVERFIWDIYAQKQTEVLIALQRRFPDMEFAQA